ncbi:LysR family transcriptional regulator [Sporolactobacillus sp. STCC-11]|uniref:LysR family transcriptional regulator n=1 Tax=Sporolactobacillus caesalpiniae TaxID=3230362 RepID=UPI003396D128
MTIDQLETFLAVVNNKGFRHASRKLFLTQPTVTTRIQMLERELNATLFIRSRRHFSLSNQGAVLLPYAQTILLLYHQAKEELKNA